LRGRFGVRLYDAISNGGPVQLLTDGRDVYVRTDAGQVFNLLRSPSQPLLVVSEEGALRTLNLRMRARGRRKKRSS
jgi:hypothetical protein